MDESPGPDALRIANGPRDVTLTLGPDDQKRCQTCSALAESLFLAQAIAMMSEPKRIDGRIEVSTAFAAPTYIEFRPCGHRFDGITGEPIEAQA